MIFSDIAMESGIEDTETALYLKKSLGTDAWVSVGIEKILTPLILRKLTSSESTWALLPKNTKLKLILGVLHLSTDFQEQHSEEISILVKHGLQDEDDEWIRQTASVVENFLQNDDDHENDDTLTNVTRNILEEFELVKKTHKQNGLVTHLLNQNQAPADALYLNTESLNETLNS